MYNNFITTTTTDDDGNKNNNNDDDDVKMIIQILIIMRRRRRGRRRRKKIKEVLGEDDNVEGIVVPSWEGGSNPRHFHIFHSSQVFKPLYQDTSYPAYPV